MNDHIISFERGHDCIRFECIYGTKSCKPDEGGSHGCGGLKIRFVSKGSAGAAQFLIYTNWLPQRAERSDIGALCIKDWGDTGFGVMPADLGYHSKAPRYEGQSVSQDACGYCDGAPCYYDGSALNANAAMYALVNGGQDALWNFLDAYYNYVFEGEDYPEPAEYPMSPRTGGRR